MIDALPLLLGPEGYQISRSVRLRSSASAYLNRTPASATNRQTWTWSGWVKRGRLGATQGLFARNDGSVATYIIFTSSDTLTAASASGAVEFEVITTQVFRDPSAWYHIVMVLDTTQATSSNRVKLYVNGVQITALSTATYPSQNYNAYVNTVATHYIGNGNPGGSLGWYSDQYLTEINFIDGQALTPSSFGETNPVTGVWQPKKYAGTYGTNGFYLNFSDNSAATAAAIGKDYSGNGNNWTPNNINVSAYTGTPPNNTAYDSMLDVPTQWADGGNGRGNYAVLNPLRQRGANTFADANLKITLTNVSSATAVATQALPIDSYYWEAAILTGGNSDVGIGIVASTIAEASMSVFASGGVGYYGNNGNKYINGSATAYGSSFTVGDVIGVAFNGTTITFYKNNVSQGAITLPAGSDWTPAFSNATTLTGQVIAPNFGQRPFSYTPPAGFKALNTLNLPAPTILKGNQYFDATLWDGNSTNARVITSNVGTVDLAWVKRRNGVDDHRLANSVLGGNKHLKSNNTDAESTGTTVIQAFSGSTFTLGTDGSVNATGGTYVGWTWQEGATQGFDIVTYTGTGANRTIAHNLGVAPAMLIVKNRTAGGAGYWLTWHKNMTSASYYLALNLTIAQTLDATVWNSTAPTSSVFSLGTNTTGNNNGTNFIAYLFSEVAGFSKFGSYTGNGSADGPFVFCGFRPRFVMINRQAQIHHLIF